MREELFVDYDIALKLKKLGFNEECLYYYDSFAYVGSSSAFWQNYNTSENLVSRPLWQQVIDWLREKHNLIVYVRSTYKPLEADKKYYISFIDSWGCLENYDLDYNEAIKKVIIKALELCEKNM